MDTERNKNRPAERQGFVAVLVTRLLPLLMFQTPDISFGNQMIR